MKIVNQICVLCATMPVQTLLLQGDPSSNEAVAEKWFRNGKDVQCPMTVKLDHSYEPRVQQSKRRRGSANGPKYQVHFRMFKHARWHFDKDRRTVQRIVQKKRTSQQGPCYNTKAQAEQHMFRDIYNFVLARSNGKGTPAPTAVAAAERASNVARDNRRARRDPEYEAKLKRREFEEACRNTKATCERRSALRSFGRRKIDVAKQTDESSSSKHKPAQQTPTTNMQQKANKKRRSPNKRVRFTPKYVHSYNARIDEASLKIDKYKNFKRMLADTFQAAKVAVKMGADDYTEHISGVTVDLTKSDERELTVEEKIAFASMSDNQLEKFKNEVWLLHITSHYMVTHWKRYLATLEATPKIKFGSVTKPTLTAVMNDIRGVWDVEGSSPFTLLAQLPPDSTWQRKWKSFDKEKEGEIPIPAPRDQQLSWLV